MLKTNLFTLGIILILSCTAVDVPRSNSKPITHDLWTELLQSHVSDDGMVDYQGFVKDREKFEKYLSLLSANHPNEKNWTYDERKAYWINAYNAFTVKLILDHYPVNSIKDIGGSIYKVNTAWDIRFIVIEGQDYDLNNIEHDILRKKYADPRIHFAVNCASISCPKLLNEAFTAHDLEIQLDDAGRRFINDKTKNRITPEKLELSRIFKWFKGDFTKETSLIEFLNRYSTVKIQEDACIDYLDYDWNLNERK